MHLDLRMGVSCVSLMARCTARLLTKQCGDSAKASRRSAKDNAIMKAYCCQFDIQWENKKANFVKVRAMLEAQKPEPESIVLLPELFAVGFSMNVGALAEPAGAETEQFLS